MAIEIESETSAQMPGVHQQTLRSETMCETEAGAPVVELGRRTQLVCVWLCNADGRLFLSWKLEPPCQPEVVYNNGSD